MKTFHLAVIGPGTFGENGDGVSFSYFFPHPFHTKFISFVYMEEACILNDFSKYRRVPYPVIGYHDNLRGKR